MPDLCRRVFVQLSASITILNSVVDFQVEVTPHVVSCDCIGFRHEPKLPCKHIFLILREEKLKWDALPTVFRLYSYMFRIYHRIVRYFILLMCWIRIKFCNLITNMLNSFRLSTNHNENFILGTTRIFPSMDTSA